ncbi:MAG: hypothetical protein ABL933_12930 [Methyloglobulus sp.]|nr:hypothetical protein [Methyloglobulus sp.]
MTTQIFKYSVYGLLCLTLGYTSQALATDYSFNQSGFSGGGKIVINFAGLDVDGGYDGYNGYTYSPDGLLAYCEDTGVEPGYVCSSYHSSGYYAEMIPIPVLSGSPLFNEVNKILSTSGVDYYKQGFFNLDTNEYRMHVDLLGFFILQVLITPWT